MIGVWTGCGFFTIPVVTPPRDFQGYNACVAPIIWNPLQPATYVPPVPAEQPQQPQQEVEEEILAILE